VGRKNDSETVASPPVASDIQLEAYYLLPIEHSLSQFQMSIEQFATFKFSSQAGSSFGTAAVTVVTVPA
jgi:hypothetical protein